MKVGHIRLVRRSTQRRAIDYSRLHIAEQNGTPASYRILPHPNKMCVLGIQTIEQYQRIGPCATDVESQCQSVEWDRSRASIHQSMQSFSHPSRSRLTACHCYSCSCFRLHPTHRRQAICPRSTHFERQESSSANILTLPWPGRSSP